MANINLTAAASRGQTPFARREAVVEADGNNVYLQFPQASGVVDSSSALALAQALASAAGVPTLASAATAGGPSVVDKGKGVYDILDPNGIIVGTLKPTQMWVFDEA